MMSFLCGFIFGTGFGMPLLKFLLKKVVPEKEYAKIVAKLRPLEAELRRSFEPRSQAIAPAPAGGGGGSTEDEAATDECTRCHCTMDIPPGYHPTKYCHACAQELVMQYEAAFELAAGAAEALPSLPEPWPVEDVHGVSHVYATFPVDQFHEQALAKVLSLAFQLEMSRRVDGASMIAEERQRQIRVEGWTPEHDDEYLYGELAKRGAALAVSHTDAIVMDDGTQVLPWKSHPAPRSLVIAGALIAAEIDSLLRISIQPVPEEVQP